MRIRMWLVGLTAGVIVTACGSDPKTGPSKVVQSLSIAGPSLIAPGATASFTATARFSDGTTGDYSSSVVWLTQNGSVLSAGANGQMTARIAGESLVTASYRASITASVNVLVLAPGTFRLTGRVLDAGYPLAGATVSVVSGTGAGLTAMTGADGQYRLYGVAGSVQVKVSFSYYSVLTESLVVNHQTVADFTMTSSVGLPNLSGTYAMTIAADRQCAAPGYALPGDVREATLHGDDHGNRPDLPGGAQRSELRVERRPRRQFFGAGRPERHQLSDWRRVLLLGVPGLARVTERWPVPSNRRRRDAHRLWCRICRIDPR